MNEVDIYDREHESAVARKIGNAAKDHPATRRWGRRLFGIGAFLLLAGGLALGGSRSYSQQRDVMATAEQIRNFVPSDPWEQRRRRAPPRRRQR
jgi:hypothetical protein